MAAAPTAGGPLGTSRGAVNRDPDGAERSTQVMPRRREDRMSDPAPAGSPWIVVGLWALLALPLAVAVAVLSSKHWVPIGDIAQTELRVRDVWSRHPPLIGLAGRIGPLGRQGSHPGPLSFWALWPFYRLAPGPMGLVAAGTTLQLLAVGGALWLAYRRGGVRLAVGAALVLALLTRTYGSVTLTEPWNPYLPLMWWFLFLVALWSVLCDDLPAFPVAVFAGSFCIQTHISYLGMVGGLSLLLIVGVAAAFRARRGGLRHRREALWWTLGGVALGVALWVPPLIEQLTRTPGNATVIWRHFTKPPDEAIGFGKGAELVLVPLNPWWWIKGQQAVLGSVVPGIAVLVVWIVAAIAAWSLGHRALVRLHLVVGAGLVLGMVSAAKIFGSILHYLALWAWGVTALLFMAVGWTVGVLVGRRMRGPQRERAWLGATATLAAVLILVVGVFTVDAASIEFRAARVSESLRRVVDPTARALASGTVPGGGLQGRYMVTWTDPLNIGTQGFGLLNELERRGFHVGAEKLHEAGVTPHRLLQPGEFTAVIHFAVGQNIEVWDAKPGVRRVAYADLRTRQERAEYERLRLEVIADLKATGQADQVPVVDGNLYGATSNPKLSSRSFRRMVRMLDLGLPVAVFVGAPAAYS